VNAALGDYRFDEAANAVYRFFWGELCDWYLEIVKLRLNFSETADKAATGAALTTLVSTFEAALRLLSPFMPFITEELWHAIYDGQPPAKSIALSRYPQPLQEALEVAVEEEMATLQDLIVTIRALRKDLEVPEKEQIAAEILASKDMQALVEANRAMIAKLARVSSFAFPELWTLPSTNSRTKVNFTLGLAYEKKIDVAAERERLRKKLEQYEKALLNAERQLHNEAFLAKAPEKVVTDLKKNALEAAALRQETLDAIEKLEGLA
jgi:valyl-tRNA synthetase